MLDYEIVARESVINNFAELGAFFGFDFEVDEVKVESKYLANLDDVVWAGELVGAVDNYAHSGIFTDGVGVKDGGVTSDKWTGKLESDDFEGVGVNDGSGNEADRRAGLDAKNWGIDKVSICN